MNWNTTKVSLSHRCLLYMLKAAQQLVTSCNLTSERERYAEALQYVVFVLVYNCCSFNHLICLIRFNLSAWAFDSLLENSLSELLYCSFFHPSRKAPANWSSLLLWFSMSKYLSSVGNIFLYLPWSDMIESCSQRAVAEITFFFLQMWPLIQGQAA